MSAATLASISSVYERGIVEAGKEPAFLFLVAFLISWGFIRTSAHMIRAQVSWWPGNVEVGGTHVHHLVWGILLMMISGWAPRRAVRRSVMKRSPCVRRSRPGHTPAGWGR